MRIQRFRLYLPWLIGAFLLALPLLPARADTLVVTKTADTNDYVCDADCSLREAVAAAVSGDTITFDAGLSGETLTLTTELVITRSIALDGSALAAHVRISGGDATRVFYIDAGADVTFVHLDVINGNAVGNGGGGYNSGRLTLTNCTFAGNNAADYGGGIFNNGALTVTHSSMVGNRARYGGGLFNNGAGVGSVNGSTLSGNHAGVSGGGIYNTGGVVTITSGTLSGNSAANLGGGINNVSGGTMSLIAATVASNTAKTGGGVYNIATLTIASTLIGDNSATTGPDCNGQITSRDHNLIENVTGCTFNGDTVHNVTGKDPQLSPLGDNGGETTTQALRDGSPALDQIPNSANECSDGPAQDQRGFARPSPDGGACDIGAYERRVNLELSKSVSPPQTALYRGAVTYTLALHNAGEGGESTVTLSDTLPASVTFAAWIGQPVSATVDGGVVAWQGAIAAGERITLTFSVTQTGGYGETITNSMWAHSLAGDSSAAAAFTVEDNLPPAADAGSPQTVRPGASVLLDGSGSSDPRGDPLTFAWAQTGGVTVSLTTDISRTAFTAPAQTGALTFTLTVSDGYGLSSDDTVVISVEAYRVYLPVVLR